MLQPDSSLPPPNTFEVSDVQTHQPHSTEHAKRKHSTELSGGDRNKDEKSNEKSVPLHIRFVNFEPKQMTCPHCHKHITTELIFHPGETTWSWCICCFLMGCVLGCCFLPFCMQRCRDVTHYCPHCHHKIAKYHRSDPTNHRRL